MTYFVIWESDYGDESWKCERYHARQEAEDAAAYRSANDGVQVFVSNPGVVFQPQPAVREARQ